MRIAAALVLGSLTAPALAAGPPANVWFPVPVNASFETGDAWIDQGINYRLYGVQACLRGTSFTNGAGLKRDCGEASLAMLVALIRDLRPQCYAAASSPQTKTVFVFCVAMVPTGPGTGSRVDLGTALISIGYAFAALTPEGRPVHLPYLGAEFAARRSKLGLWAFSDVPDPGAIILRALRSASAAPAPLPSQSNLAPRLP